MLLRSFLLSGGQISQSVPTCKIHSHTVVKRVTFLPYHMTLATELIHHISSVSNEPGNQFYRVTFYIYLGPTSLTVRNRHIMLSPTPIDVCYCSCIASMEVCSSSHVS